MKTEGNFEVVDKSYDFYASKVDEELKEREKVFDIMAISKDVREKTKQNNSINISLIALEELEKLGFKMSYQTSVFAKLIEDIYFERDKFCSKEYFDLSLPDNLHYKYLAEELMVGTEKFYRGVIASAIGLSNCEKKNINEIVDKVVNKISKKLKNKTKKLSLEMQKN